MVRRASTASARPRISASVRIVSGPTAGRSKRVSCVGLHTFTTTMSPLASWPARRMVASVPSMPSTAITAPLRTTTLCPMSNCPITFAARKPKRISLHSSSLGGRDPRTPASGTISCRYSVDSTTAIPSVSSSAASARSTRSSRSLPRRARSRIARASGLSSRKSRGLAMPPTITVRRMPAARSARIIASSSPGWIQVMAPTTRSSAGSVSPR